MALRRLIRKGLRSAGVSLSFAGSGPLVLPNVFQSTHRKRALVSLARKAFLSGPKRHHSLGLETQTAARLLHELGYRVDVVDSQETRLDDDELAPYELIFGSGAPLERSFYIPERDRIRRILYSNSADVTVLSRASALRVRDFRRTEKVLLPEAARLAPFSWRLQAYLCDLVIVLGNRATAQTYLDECPDLNVRSLRAFYFELPEPDLSDRDFATARRSFVWFGSSGALHKGLDLLLRYFAERPELTLHVCGLHDPSFRHHFARELTGRPNVRDHRFIPVDAPQFRELLKGAAAVVMPSASEGGAAAVVNLMAHGGLVPIVSRACGLDVEPYGFVFDRVDAASLAKAIERFLILSPAELAERTGRIRAQVRQEYSYARYEAALRSALQQALPG